MILENNHLLPIYYKFPFIIKKAKGMYVYSKEKKYLDLFSSLAVNSLGHRNKKIIRSIKKQLKKYLHISNYFIDEQFSLYAKLLVESSFPSKVVFTNSGTEANEVALKVLKLYGKKTNKNKIIAFTNSFHGRTLGSMSVTGKKVNEKFKPLLPNITFIKFNCLDDLRKNIDDDTCGVIVELIQGEGGVNVLDKEYVYELMSLKEKYKFLLVIDEIQTGLYRTGLMYAFQHYKITPDVLTLGKSLGGGLPLGATLISEEYCDLMNVGDHGSTFAPNPVAISCGITLFKEISKFKYYHRINLLSDYLKLKLNNLKKTYPNIISEVKGLGFMIGICIEKGIEIIKDELFHAKILINVTNSNIIRLLPAFIIKKKHIDFFLEKFEEAIQKVEV